MNKKYLPLKTFLDIFFAFLGIIFCFLFLWWWIFVINLFMTKGHPFFSQKRYGKGKKPFQILKFRSMKNSACSYIAPSNMSGAEQYKMETKFGHFLRKSQLDETLQLFNILVGQMSFVGPRPGAIINEEQLVTEREKYTPNAYVVRPGLTGLAQIYLKDRHNPEMKAKLDHEYVEKISLWLDIKLFTKTICRAFKRSDGAR